MPKANCAAPGNGDLADPLPIHESAIRAAGVLQQPAAALLLDNGVLPGNPRVGDDDVRLRVAADPVGRARLQQPVDAGALDVQLLARDRLRGLLGPVGSVFVGSALIGSVVIVPVLIGSSGHAPTVERGPGRKDGPQTIRHA